MRLGSTASQAASAKRGDCQDRPRRELAIALPSLLSGQAKARWADRKPILQAPIEMRYFETAF